MMKVNEDYLYQLHAKVAQVLMQQVEDEEVSPAMLAQAIKFLFQNEITVSTSEDENLSQFSDLLNEKRKKRNLKLISGDE